MTEPTHTDADVERVRRAIRDQLPATKEMDAYAPDCARAALAALPQREVSVQEAARVLLAEWDDHGEGLLGNVSCYSPAGDIDCFQMDADIDGEWVKQKDVENALRTLAGDKS